MAPAIAMVVVTSGSSGTAAPGLTGSELGGLRARRPSPRRLGLAAQPTGNPNTRDLWWDPGRPYT